MASSSLKASKLNDQSEVIRLIQEFYRQTEEAIESNLYNLKENTVEDNDPAENMAVLQEAEFKENKFKALYDVARELNMVMVTLAAVQSKFIKVMQNI